MIETEFVGDSDNIPIATVRLKGGELHIEAMSEERLEQAFEAVASDFGDIAEPVERDVTPIEEHLEGRRADVVRLVRVIENHADRARHRGEPGADVEWLRAELAIDEDLAA